MKNKEIEELLNELKDNIPEDYIRSVDTKEGIGRYELDINSWQYKLLSYIETLENRNKELYEGFMATQEELTDYATKNEQLENNRDKAIEVINTQLKNAENGLKDNLRIIKFNLIKGSCTFEDLKTEEDYKYILKGDSDE